MTEKPKSIDEYKRWAAEKHGHDFGKRCATWYGAATQNLLQTLQASFLVQLQDSLEAAAPAYRSGVGSDLFVTSDVPVLHWTPKTFESMIDKLYRLNVLWNKRWPRPPAAPNWAADSEGGSFIGPYDCLRRLDDIIRTRIVCKYLDGPTFLAPRINDLAHKFGVGCEVSTRELDAGYYSHHIYFDVETETIGPGFESVRTNSRVELQITTQLQDVLMSLTHRFYEKDRLELSRQDRPWRWDYKTTRFKGAYLGHTLHLLEAIVIEVRDQSGETNA